MKEEDYICRTCNTVNESEDGLGYKCKNCGVVTSFWY